MNIIYGPQGSYQTNCYIVPTDNGEVIIDPGENAAAWVKSKVKNPKAILNTHGHHDHIWSNQELKKEFNIPIYCPKGDVFMLSSGLFGENIPKSTADFEVNPDEKVTVDGLDIIFWHFPGHTPGCSSLQIKDMLFSGDFIFKRSIGRVDFPYSNPDDMKKSILKVLEFKEDLKIYPGHGEPTTLKEEQQVLPSWLRFI